MQTNTPTRPEILNEITEGLVEVINDLLRRPIIKYIFKKGVLSFNKTAEDHELNDPQIGEVALIIFNKLKAILNKPETRKPNETPPAPEISATVEETMGSVHKALSMTIPVPQICRKILAEVIKRCEILINEHQIQPTEIEIIGEKTWTQVRETIIPGLSGRP